MTKLNGIKACAFDAYGTLFDIHAPSKRVASELGDQAQAISDLWRAKQLQYTWLRSLMKAHADFWQVTGDALDFALGAHGIEDPELRERLMGLYLELDAYDDAVDALRNLKNAGMSTALLSNGSPAMLDAAVKASGLGEFLDHAISVEEAGIYKPDAAVYSLAVQHLGHAAEEICFVSANGWDACGAAHFGLQVVHLNRFAQPAERLPGAPKAVIGSLAALPDLLS